MNKILVTGAAGFIGFHFAGRLLKAGYSVIGLDNMNDYYDINLKKARLSLLEKSPDFQFVKMDIAERQHMTSLFEKEEPEIVVHLAAQAGVRYSLINPYAYLDSNLAGFLNILEECRHKKIKHLVYAGLRFFTVYGPWGRPDMALFLFTKAILEERPIDVYNNGKMQRDFTYIDDIVEGVFRVMNKIPEPDPNWNGAHPDPATSFAPYRIYNIGNNNPVELLEFINILEKQLGKKAVMNLLPLQPGDVPATYADVDDLMKDVGFKPATSIEDGIRHFVQWYRDYYTI
ncbi:MAG: NAD-dependent epimerase/dehydratase family protein [Deltaproteobacteria bacterium]|nr:NAD-dependent epimerase/dehydratase family protein [Deltaproteobacteria bacterium]